jgi:hypothetical protein
VNEPACVPIRVDRLLLGLKGTISEAELHVIRARMQGGLKAKARRGELKMPLPVGFVHDIKDRVVFDPDQRVQDTIRLFFSTYKRLSSMAATVRELNKKDILFPCRMFSGPRKGEVVFKKLTLTAPQPTSLRQEERRIYKIMEDRGSLVPGGIVSCDSAPSESHNLMSLCEEEKGPKKKYIQELTQATKVELEKENIPFYLYICSEEMSEEATRLLEQLLETNPYIVGIEFYYVKFSSTLKIGPWVQKIFINFKGDRSFYPDLSHAKSLISCFLNYTLVNDKGPEGSLQLCQGSPLQLLYLKTIKQPPLIGEAENLKYLSIQHGSSMTKVPCIEKNLKLKGVHLNYLAITSLPDFRSHEKLEVLEIHGCPKVTDGLLIPKNIKKLAVTYCSKMEIPPYPAVDGITDLCQKGTAYYEKRKTYKVNNAYNATPVSRQAPTDDDEDESTQAFSQMHLHENTRTESSGRGYRGRGNTRGGRGHSQPMQRHVQGHIQEYTITTSATFSPSSTSSTSSTSAPPSTQNVSSQQYRGRGGRRPPRGSRSRGGEGRGRGNSVPHQ